MLKRYGCILAIALAICFVSPFSSLVFAEEGTEVVTVDNASDLQEAIFNAQAGDTIYLEENTTYNLEELTYKYLQVYTDDITIQGAEGSVIKGSSTAGYVIRLQASGVTLEGFTIDTEMEVSNTNSAKQYAIKCETADANPILGTEKLAGNIIIKDIEIVKSQHTAIDINGVDNVTIDNVTIGTLGKGAGILLANCSDITITDCNFDELGGSAWYGIGISTSELYDETISNISIDSISAKPSVWYEAKGTGNVMLDTIFIDDVAVYAVPQTPVKVAGLLYHDLQDAIAVAKAWNTYVIDAATNNKIVTVSTAIELQNAIKNANEGDTILVSPGEYDIAQDNVTVLEGQTGWYLPISQKGLTIIGVDAEGKEITDPAKTMANIYSSDYSVNSNLATQNLITIFGEDVTIKGLTIMHKAEANKSIEILANNFTLEACKLAPTSGASEGEEFFGGVVYFNGNSSDGGQIKNNLFINGRITLNSTTESEILITGNTFEGLNIKEGETFRTIGYTAAGNPADISKSNIIVSKNNFFEDSRIDFSEITNGSLDASENYWGENGLSAEKIADLESKKVHVDSYYAEADCNEGSLIVLTAEGPEVWHDLQDVIAEAKLKAAETSKYTAASITNLNSAITLAEDVKKDQTKAAIDKAIQDLQSAINKLILKPSGGGTPSSGGSSSSSTTKAPTTQTWKQDAIGWWLQTGTNTYAKSEWKLVNNSWYYFNDNGYMVTGWVLWNNQWYYLKDSGAMATGWLLYNNKWFFLNSNGSMATGWILNNNKWYFLYDSGDMAINWLFTGNSWYYLNASGDMTTDPLQYQGKEYQFNQSGACINP